MFDLAPDIKAIVGEPVSGGIQRGLSNHVLRVETQNGVFFVRTGENASGAPVNRFHEARNLSLAASLGLAVPALWVSADKSILVTRAVECAETGHRGLPVLLGRQLARLHSSGVAFQGEIEPAQLFESYLDRIQPEIDQLNSGGRFPDLVNELASLGELFNKPATNGSCALVPSHGDLSPGNCLVAGGKLWLIDWEFSGMADPCWDLAYAIIENAFDSAAETEFLNAYQQASGCLVEMPDLQTMKAKCDAISALWALSQLAEGRDPEAFSMFARERCTRAPRHIPN